MSLVDPSLAPFDSKGANEKINRMMSQRSFRDLSGPEIISLSKAAKALHERKLISTDASALFEDFLGSGNLKYLVEA